jgi:hypothetical protein
MSLSKLRPGTFVLVTIELSPRPPDDERPSDYASLTAEQVNLDNVINELLLCMSAGQSDPPQYSIGPWSALFRLFSVLFVRSRIVDSG